MKVNGAGRAVLVAWALATAGAVHAIGVVPASNANGTGFAADDDRDRDNVKSWHVYFDPTGDAVTAPDLTFSVAAYGTSKPGPGHEKTHLSFGHETKHDLNLHDQHFGKREHYDVSNFHGYGHHSHWKPEENGDYCVPSIPEPQTYVLLLAGLSLMTVIARRRRQVAE